MELQLKQADFKTDLQFSIDQANAPFWEQIYREAFPDLIAMVNVRSRDNWAQRGGIDRVLTTKSGRVWTVDEKVRREKWNDILLEVTADVDRNSPGWVVKDLACDFICYAFLPSSEAYLLPVPALQRAWRINGQDWLWEYGTIVAHNKSWRSQNCPVPIPILMRKIAEAMFVRWSNFDLKEAA